MSSKTDAIRKTHCSTQSSWCLFLGLYVIRWTRRIVSMGVHVPFLTISSNGNIFHVTGLLWGEWTGQRRILLTKASFSLICAWINGWGNNRNNGDLRCVAFIMMSSQCQHEIFVRPLDDPRWNTLIAMFTGPICGRQYGGWQFSEKITVISSEKIAVDPL